MMEINESLISQLFGESLLLLPNYYNCGYFDHYRQVIIYKSLSTRSRDFRFEAQAAAAGANRLASFFNNYNNLVSSALFFASLYF